MKKVIFSNRDAKLAKSPVQASRADLDEGLQLMLDSIKSDFDYILDGLDKLGRSGPNSSKEAEAIAENLSHAMNGVIKEIASKVVE